MLSLVVIREIDLATKIAKLNRLVGGSYMKITTILLDVDDNEIEVGQYDGRLPSKYTKSGIRGTFTVDDKEFLFVRYKDSSEVDKHYALVNVIGDEGRKIELGFA